MMFPPVHLFVIAIILLFTHTRALGIVHREPCADNYTRCSPPGARSSIVPAVGDALSGLYFDLISSVNPQPVIRDITEDHTPAAICCK